MTPIEIGKLYTHRLHGLLFVLGKANDYNVTVLSVMQAKEYLIPNGIFRKWFVPYRRET